jgi:hypothetical protein
MAEDSRPSIVRNQEWDSTTTKLYALDLAQLVFGLLGGDTVHGEAALDVEDEAEVLVGFLDRDDIHEAGGVGNVGANLVVDLDEALHHDGLRLAAVERQEVRRHSHWGWEWIVVLVERVLESVTDKHDEWKAFPELVGTGTGFL